MKSSTDRDPRDERWDKSDPLWRLLGESPRPEPDAWFVTRTMARCRKEAVTVAGSAGASFWRLWRWVLGGGFGVCLAMILMVAQVHTTAKATTEQKDVQDAFEYFASLPSPGAESDSTTTSSSSSSTTWQDSSL